MISGGHDTGFNKLKTINRRMFIFSAAKAVIFFGIVGRLFSLQISENKKYLNDALLTSIAGISAAMKNTG